MCLVLFRVVLVIFCERRYRKVQREKPCKRPGDHSQNEVSNVTKWRDSLRIETARWNESDVIPDGVLQACFAAPLVTTIRFDHRQREERQAMRLAW